MKKTSKSFVLSRSTRRGLRELRTALLELSVWVGGIGGFWLLCRFWPTGM